MSVGNNENVCGGKGGAINEIQNFDVDSISGRKYYCLKCTLTEGSRIKAVDEALSKHYSESMFVNDWKNNNGVVWVRFDGTAISHSFLWKTIIGNPSTFMFFGSPLSWSRNFDYIFRNIKSTATLHHCFMYYWKEVEGDVISSYALLNLYQSYQLGIMTSKHDKMQKQRKED